MHAVLRIEESHLKSSGLSAILKFWCSLICSRFNKAGTEILPNRYIFINHAVGKQTTTPVYAAGRVF